jgi:8-oxo-dGTP pyrophosphatase MutT (NUDIX family)
MIRELYEETGIKLSDCDYEFDSDDYSIFSSPKRALANGGVPRTTVAFTIKLMTKPEITANDDAVDCQWFKLSEALNKLTMFSDHRDIIIKLTGAYPMPAYVNSIFKV